MRTILALALIVAMLAIPAVAGDPGGIPNENAGGSIASFVDIRAIGFAGDFPGFAEIGQATAASEPGQAYDNLPGVSAAAHELHGPQ